MKIKLLTAPPTPNEITLQEQKFRQELAARVSRPKISEYETDPANPRPGDIWVLNTLGTYELSYRTEAGSTVRVTLT